MRPQRVRASEAVQAGAGRQSDDLIDLLNWFDHVGMLVQLKALDAAMVWNNLSYWIVGYWAVTRDLAKVHADFDANTWTYFDSLARRMCRIEGRMQLKGRVRRRCRRIAARKRAKAYRASVVQDDEQASFLAKEAALLTE